MAKQSDESKLNITLNPEHTKILYTDMVFINVNEDGTILDICQKVETSNQYQVVTRIGMSRSMQINL